MEFIKQLPDSVECFRFKLSFRRFGFQNVVNEIIVDRISKCNDN